MWCKVSIFSVKETIRPVAMKKSAHIVFDSSGHLARRFAAQLGRSWGSGLVAANSVVQASSLLHHTAQTLARLWQEAFKLAVRS
jgi:hypothetical protein